MAAPEGGGHGSAASGRVLDDVRSGARVGGPAFQISVSDRPRDRGRGARLRAGAAAASVRPAVPARARIAADSLPGGPAHVLARVQGEHPPDRAARRRSGDRDHARRRRDPEAPHSRHTMVRCVRSRGDRVAPRRSGGDLHSFAAQHPAQRGHRARGREPGERRLGPGDLQVRGGGGAHRRIIARSVWNLLVFLLSTLIFLLIGVQLSAIVARLTDYSVGELFFYGTFVSAVAIFVRFAWVYPATYLPLVLRALLGEQVAPPREGEVFIMGWCGMRGIVSLAAALALPQTLEDGSAFPERDLIIFLTFVVIAVTLVLQGLTLKPLIRMLKVGRDWSLQEEKQRAQMALGKAAIAAIDAVAAKSGIPNELAERIRAEFAEKITLSVPEGLVLRHSGADDARRLRDAAVKAERQELIRLWRENQISDEVLHHIEEDLDYQESRI